MQERHLVAESDANFVGGRIDVPRLRRASQSEAVTAVIGVTILEAQIHLSANRYLGDGANEPASSNKTIAYKPPCAPAGVIDLIGSIVSGKGKAAGSRQ
jgi:hypothetical protein